MKIQLINAPLSDNYLEISRSGSYPPLNLIALSSYLKEASPHATVEILDGDILSQTEIIDRLSADIIGISPKILTHDNAIAIAAAAKATGATVIMGGAHATFYCSEILMNHTSVDFVVIGDGEEALARIVNDKPAQDIPNIAFMESGSVKANRTLMPDLDCYPLQDLSFIDLKPYNDNFAFNFSRFGFHRAASVYSRKGCHWQVRRGGCIFCRNYEQSVRMRSPKRVWEEVQKLVEDFGADFIWDVSDAVTSDAKWLEDFRETKPSSCNPSFLMYGRSDQISRRVAAALAGINCFEMLIGAESGDDQLLRRSNKGIKVEQTLESAAILKEFDIWLYPSFILGLPGETKVSALKTLHLAETLLGKGKVYQLAASIMIPLPGSQSFNMVRNHPKLRDKYLGRDIFDIEELKKDWVTHFCDVEFDYLEEIMEKVLALTPIRSSFGRPRKRAAISLSSRRFKEPPEILGMDFSKEEKSEAIEKERLLLLTVLTAMDCNFRCPYCFTKGWDLSKGVPLDLSEWDYIFKEARTLGAKSVWWVGVGEPLMLSSHLDFVRTIRQNGLVPLCFTNGSLLTERTAAELFDLGASVYIKVNSFDPEIQDNLVGKVPGASEKIQRGLRFLMEAGFNKTFPSRLALQSVLTRQNLKDIPNLYRWARRNNVIPFFEIIVHTNPVILESIVDFDLTKEEMKKIFEKLLEIDEKEFGYSWFPSPPYVGRQCDKYKYALTIDPFGDVLSCAASKVTLGNIRQQSLSELRKHPLLADIRNINLHIEGKCGTCEIECSGCRAEVFTKTGNILGEFERCWKV